MKFYITISATAILLYMFLRPSSSSELLEQSLQPVAQVALAIKENGPSARKMAPALPIVPTVTVPAVNEASILVGQANMSAMLNRLSECTDIKNSIPTSAVEPTVSSILDSVQSELGEPVIRSEDWNSTEIKMPNGARRLIRMETVYEENDIVKRLVYYEITNEALMPIELSSDQSVNPSETFIASLEKEGDIVSREKSERVFFQNGEEIMYTEKNGKMQSSEIIRAGKSLKCGDYGQHSFKCQCF